MLWQFITENLQADVTQLALQRKRYPLLSDSDFRFCLQQIDGRQRTRDKLPSFAEIKGWLYPPRLNLEQCSSERTARFKAGLLASLDSQTDNRQSPIVNGKLSNCKLIDATGGYGVDTFFMSEQVAETHYFEQNTELAAIAEHNFRLAGKSIVCHAEAFTVDNLSHFLGGKSEESRGNVLPLSGVLYLDPARRDSHGGKVFRLEDCTPNVIGIVSYVQRNCPNIRLLLKLSPMLDIRQAVLRLAGNWDIYILSISNEVKELLLLSGGTNTIHAVSLDGAATTHGQSANMENLQAASAYSLSFTPAEEQSAEALFCPADQSLQGWYLYEPDAAILKAGAFRLLSARFGLLKAAPNTHLYLSPSHPLTPSPSNPLPPGRTWQIIGVYTRAKEVQRALTRANVLARNYVLPADILRKQLRLKDGGDDYIIGCHIAAKPLLLHCRRCYVI